MTLTKLREIAMAAAQGTWEVRVTPAWNSHDPYALVACARTHQQSPRKNEQRDKANADADHIAIFSPEMVLKLLEVIEAAEECLEGFTRHPHPAMKYNEHQVRHGAHEDFAIALAALKGTE